MYDIQGFRDVDLHSMQVIRCG